MWVNRPYSNKPQRKKPTYTGISTDKIMRFQEEKSLLFQFNAFLSHHHHHLYIVLNGTHMSRMKLYVSNENFLSPLRHVHRNDHKPKIEDKWIETALREKNCLRGISLSASFCYCEKN